MNINEQESYPTLHLDTN